SVERWQECPTSYELKAARYPYRRKTPAESTRDAAGDPRAEETLRAPCAHGSPAGCDGSHASVAARLRAQSVHGFGSKTPASDSWAAFSPVPRAHVGASSSHRPARST